MFAPSDVILSFPSDWVVLPPAAVKVFHLEGFIDAAAKSSLKLAPAAQVWILVPQTALPGTTHAALPSHVNGTQAPFAIVLFKGQHHHSVDPEVQAVPPVICAVWHTRAVPQGSEAFGLLPGALGDIGCCVFNRPATNMEATPKTIISSMSPIARNFFLVFFILLLMVCY